MRNQYGLSRAIPEDIKRQVRQRCGHGCVVCGSALIDYEHIHPEFSKARKHDPDGITLLCPGCHAKRTRNYLSRGRILRAMEDPAAKRSGFAFSELEASTTHPYIVFAGMVLRDCQTPVEIGGLPLLRIEDSEEPGTPFRVSASFYDAAGNPSLFIRQNEWQVFSAAWDAEAIGGSVTVRTAPGEIALRLRFDPGQGVIVERIHMLCRGYLVEGGKDHFEVTPPGGGRWSFTGGLCDGARVGLALG